MRSFIQRLHLQTEMELKREGDPNPSWGAVKNRINTFTPYELVNTISDYLEYEKEACTKG